MYITLEQAKKQLLVDEDFRTDDMYILDLIAVAEDSVSKHLDIYGQICNSFLKKEL